MHTSRRQSSENDYAQGWVCDSRMVVAGLIYSNTYPIAGQKANNQTSPKPSQKYKAKEVKAFSTVRYLIFKNVK